MSLALSNTTKKETLLKPSRSSYLSAVSLAALILWVGLATTTHASLPSSTRRAPFSKDRSDDLQALEVLLDDVIPRQMAMDQIVGGQVAVVKDGQILLVKGYGTPNADTDTPVDPDTTLFRAGSVSKLFAWTAVMQLVEQGKLDLYADVNPYLSDFQIPATFDQPITLYHLMTHTAGFDERELNGVSVVRDVSAFTPLPASVARALPARIENPGEIVAYCNYCAALAGQIVANVSGEPFEQYVANHIFNPLEMSHSTFVQPVPPPLAETMATGYQMNEEEAIREAVDNPFIQISPAGSLSTTATDMAHFMIAHLKNGQYGDTRMLQPDTLAEMHRQQYTFDPRLPGVTLGFFEGERDGVRTLWHAGNVDGFGSWLTLLPDDDMGIYVVFNSRSKEYARLAVTNAIIDPFHPPAPVTATTPPSDVTQRAAEFEGSFQSTRRSEMTVQKLASYFNPETKVIANPDGTLSIEGNGPGLTERDGTLKRWVEIEPLLFQEVGGQAWLAFRANGAGDITEFVVSSFPFVAYERRAWYEQPSSQLLGVGAVLLFQLGTGVLWLIVAIAGRGKPRGGTRTAWERGTRWVAGLVIVVNLLLVISVVAWLLFGGITYHIPPTFYVTVVLAVLSVIGAVLLTVGTVQLWRQRAGYVGTRWHYTLLTLTAWGFVAFLYTARLVGIHI